MQKSRLDGARRRRASLRGGLFVALLAVEVLAVSVAHAGGFSISILGGRRTGMQAMLGSPDDETALFHNPAGLGELPGTRFHFSGSTTFFSTEFQLKPLDATRFPEINPKDCGTGNNAACPWPVDPKTGFYAKAIQPESYFGVLPYLGFSKDLGFIGPKWKNVVVSMALTAPNLYGANLPLGAPTAYNFIKGYFAVLSLITGAGWKINDHVSVGFGVSYNYMRLDYGQRISLADVLRGSHPTSDDAVTADAAQAVIGDVRLDYSGSDHGVGWNFGVLLHPTKWFNFGLSYNGATAANFNGDVNIAQVDPASRPPLQGGLRQFASGLGFKLPYQLTVQMPIPHSLQAGVTFKVNPKLEIGLDYRVWFYNAYKEQVIVPHYSATERGREPLTQADLSRRKDYNISYEISTGVLVRPWSKIPGLELMAGIGYDESPVPSAYLSLDNPALNQLVFSTGVRWQVNPRWRLSGTYMALAYLERNVEQSALNPPINMKGRGLAHIPRIEVEYMNW